MGLIQAHNPGITSPGEIIAWQIDTVEEEDPFVSGYTIALSQTPVDANSILVYSEGLVLYPIDWNYDSVANEIDILFGADPSTDTADGVWHFFVQYPYAP